MCFYYQGSPSESARASGGLRLYLYTPGINKPSVPVFERKNRARVEPGGLRPVDHQGNVESKNLNQAPLGLD